MITIQLKDRKVYINRDCVKFLIHEEQEKRVTIRYTNESKYVFSDVQSLHIPND